METFIEVWSLICDYLKKQIPEVSFNLWILKIQPVSLDFNSGSVVLKVPTSFHRDIILKSYQQQLNDAFLNVLGSVFKIDVITQELVPAYDEVEMKKDKKSEDYEYTFDTFIVGSSNKFAHAAAMAVATKPASLYNPLFIHGNSGLGKTHLLYAICSEIQKNNPQTNIIYVKSEEFTNELIEALRHGTMTKFRQKYRKSDILLVDDIQFIAGKESTQEEFFHTFNTLYEAKKQIVLTSDRPPKDIATLEERLLNRFEWGLMADIQPPDFETRMAIIKRKAELLEFYLPDQVSEYIANKLKNNIRQLEGAVKKVQAYCLLESAPPNIKTAQDAISDIINNDKPAPMTIEKIIEEVGRTFGTTADDIRSSKRSSNISKARQVAVYIVREITQLPYDAIGKEFGGRDHSTIVYAQQKIESVIQKDPKMKDTVEDIIKNIRDR